MEALFVVLAGLAAAVKVCNKPLGKALLELVEMLRQRWDREVCDWENSNEAKNMEIGCLQAAYANLNADYHYLDKVECELQDRYEALKNLGDYEELQAAYSRISADYEALRSSPSPSIKEINDLQEELKRTKERLEKMLDNGSAIPVDFRGALWDVEVRLDVAKKISGICCLRVAFDMGLKDAKDLWEQKMRDGAVYLFSNPLTTGQMLLVLDRNGQIGSASRLDIRVARYEKSKDDDFPPL